MRTEIAVLCAAVLLVGASELAVGSTCNIVNGVKHGDCAGVTVRWESQPLTAEYLLSILFSSRAPQPSEARREQALSLSAQPA